MICNNIQNLSEENSPSHSQYLSEDNSSANALLGVLGEENSRKRKLCNEYEELLTSPILYEGYSYTRNAVRIASKFF